MISKSDIKHLRSLKQKKYREKYNEFLIEGFRVIKFALESDSQLKTLFLTDRFNSSYSSDPIMDKIKNKIESIKIIDEKIMRKITNTETPSGISALCSLPKLNRDIKSLNGPGLFLDSIADPGNLGTICRTALWFGVNNIILSEKCVDPFNPKVLRGGMGSHFFLKFYSISIKNLSENNYKIIGTDTLGIPINEYNWEKTDKWVLVLGGEAQGISQENRILLDETISIPKYGHGESLNVAISGAILLSGLSGCFHDKNL